MFFRLSVGCLPDRKLCLPDLVFPRLDWSVSFSTSLLFCHSASIFRTAPHIRPSSVQFPFFVRAPFIGINRYRIVSNFAFSSIRSSSLISFAFVFFLVRSDTAFAGELSLVCESLIIPRSELVAKVRGKLLLVTLGVRFATVSVVELAFATLGLAFSELEVLSAFAVLAVVSYEISSRAWFNAVTNNLGVTEVTIFVTVFPDGPIA